MRAIIESDARTGLRPTSTTAALRLAEDENVEVSTVYDFARRCCDAEEEKARR